MENDHPEPNSLQGHTYIPQRFQKKVTGESAKKSGRPSPYSKKGKNQGSWETDLKNVS